MMSTQQNEDEKKRMLRVALLPLLLLTAILVMIPSSLAIPVPHGIDGYVFDLDSGYQVPSGTSVTITNLETSRILTLSTGQGPHTGRYSIVLEGIDGDRISIVTNRDGEWANRTVILNGSMHQVNLYLNLTGGGITAGITTSSQSPSIDESDGEMSHRSVPEIIEIAGIIEDNSGDGIGEVIVTNLATRETVQATMGPNGGRSFTAVITGGRGDALEIRYKDAIYQDEDLVFEGIAEDPVLFSLIYDDEMVTLERDEDIPEVTLPIIGTVNTGILVGMAWITAFIIFMGGGATMICVDESNRKRRLSKRGR